MEIDFSKYNGAGNDFILIDDRDNLINDNKLLISYLCDRHFGVGADGLIILKESNNCDFEILHYTSMEIWDHYVEMVPDVLYYLRIIKIL